MIIDCKTLLEIWKGKKSPEEVAGFVFFDTNWLEVILPDSRKVWRCDEKCTILPAKLDIVQRLRDGSLICSDCLSKLYPDKEQPDFGWTVGPCCYHRRIYRRCQSTCENVVHGWCRLIV